MRSPGGICQVHRAFVSVNMHWLGVWFYSTRENLERNSLLNLHNYFPLRMQGFIIL